MTTDVDDKYLRIASPELDFEELSEYVLDCVRDYERPSYTDMMHPFSLLSLKREAKKDPELGAVLDAFVQVGTREKEHRRIWGLILDTIRFQVTTDNRVIELNIGDTGTGKSSVAIMLSLLIKAGFDDFEEDTHPDFSFARSPSAVNKLLGDVDEQRVKTVLTYDEAEEEASTGSAKNRTAVLQAVRTNRVMRHSLCMCSPDLEDFGRLARRCDFVLRTLFKDKENRVNWCIAFSRDFWKRRLHAEGIFAVPLPPYPEFVKLYEDWKERVQRELSMSGGILAPRGEVVDAADRLIAYLKREGLTEESAAQFEEVLFTELEVNASSLTGDQRKLAALRAKRLLKKKRPGAGTGSSKGAFTGNVSNLREAVLMRMVERGCDPDHVKALDIRVHQHVSQDEVALVLKNEHGIKVSQVTVHNWLTDGAFVAEMGYSFEDVYSRLLTIQGVAHIAGGGNEDAPDIVLFDTENNPRKVLSLKCYVDKRDYTSINRSEIAVKELAMAETYEIPLELIFLNLWDGVLHEPQEDAGQETFTFRRPEGLK